MIELVPTHTRWPKVALGELCDIRGGFPAPQDDKSFENGTVPFVRMRDVGRYHFTKHLSQTDQSLSRSHFESGHYELTPRGAILMPRSGSVALNHRAVLGIDAVVVSHLCALVITSNRIIVDFLYRFLCLADMRKLTKKTTGLDSIAFSDLRMVAIPLPPLPEQRRIAAILDKADALRTKRRAAIAQLETLTQSIFLDMFGDPATNPKGWPIQRIGDLLESASYGTSEKSQAIGEFPVIRMNNITRTGEMDFSDLKFMDLEESQHERYLVRNGDVLFNRTNSADLVGKTGIFRESRVMAYAGYLIRLRTNDDNDPEYLSAFLNTSFSKRVLRGMCKSIIGMANINATEVRGIKVPLPPLGSQRAFASRIWAIEHLKSTHRSSLAQLDTLFASLQHLAFRGAL